MNAWAGFWSVRQVGLGWEKRLLAAVLQLCYTVVMSDADILAEAVRRIDAHCHPRKVLLFGSRARGEARSDSDFDLAVVVGHVQDKWKLESALYGVVGGLHAPFDILVFDEAYWQKWSVFPLAFEHTIAEEGKVLLDAA